jgi:hypothetical protein
MGMMRSRQSGLAALALIAIFSSASAQSAGAHALWRVYFAAGAKASYKDSNWPEAEALYTSAMKQAETESPQEPFLLFAKYSLGTVYWEQGRKDEAVKVFDALSLKLDPAIIHSDIRESVDELMSLGNQFYQEAAADEKDAEDKKLEGDALKASKEDAHQKYRFSRRYYEWAAIIDGQFFSARSPELQDVVGNLAVMNFKVEDYPEAIKNLLQLKEIVQAATQRDAALSSGSLAYSLASKGSANQTKDAMAPGSQILFDDTAIDVYLALSYEDEADAVYRDNPAEAVQDFTLAENYVTLCMKDPKYIQNGRTTLARLYGDHAYVLRQMKQIPEAEKFEALAKQYKPAAAPAAK